jgi:hypothetical protein
MEKVELLFSSQAREAEIAKNLPYSPMTAIEGARSKTTYIEQCLLRDSIHVSAGRLHLRDDPRYKIQASKLSTQIDRMGEIYLSSWPKPKEKKCCSGCCVVQ